MSVGEKKNILALEKMLLFAKQHGRKIIIWHETKYIAQTISKL